MNTDTRPGQGHIQSAACLRRDLIIYGDGRARDSWNRWDVIPSSLVWVSFERHSCTAGKEWMVLRQMILTLNDLGADKECYCLLSGRWIRKRKAPSVQTLLILVLHTLGNLSQWGPWRKITPKEHLIVFIKYLVCAANKVYNIFFS